MLPDVFFKKEINVLGLFVQIWNSCKRQIEYRDHLESSDQLKHNWNTTSISKVKLVRNYFTDRQQKYNTMFGTKLNNARNGILQISPPRINWFYYDLSVFVYLSPQWRRGNIAVIFFYFEMKSYFHLKLTCKSLLLLKNE